MSQKKTARMSLTNIRTGETWVVQYNPAEVTESVSPNYNELDVPGLSYQPLQYKGTGNHTWKLDIRNIRHPDRGLLLREEDFDMEQFKNFLFSLCYAPAGANDVRGGSPDEVLFVWPKLAQMVVRIKAPLEFKHTRFAVNGRAVESQATLNLIEARTNGLTAESVRTKGSFRTG